MAQYEIKRSCGHVETVNICGTNVHGERERQAEYEATKACYECYKAQRDAEAHQANAGLPALVGSDKQVKWAESIRAEAAKEAEELRAWVNKAFDAAKAEGKPESDDETRATVLGYIDQVMARTSASDWIDTRNIRVKTLAAKLQQA